MFTGVVEEVGTVRYVAPNDTGTRIEVAASHAIEGLALGDNVNVGGVSLAVVERDDRGFATNVASGLLRRTTLGALTRGSRVNLERAVTADRGFGGHFVQGQVDATTKMLEWQAEGEGSRLRFALPKELSRYVVTNGFIALDGVSLAVTKLAKSYFEIAIDARGAQTTLSALRPGGVVNVEVDVLAKYVERAIGARRRGSG